jgi:hypothetical protein
MIGDLNYFPELQEISKTNEFLATNVFLFDCYFI